jgi:tRNA pseudouridine38-40 synthase
MPDEILDPSPAATPVEWTVPETRIALAERTTRLRLDISYDGTDFRGWAAQPGHRTVQGELEAALTQVTRAALRVTVAGRTDSGVHAHGQVCHVDIPDGALATLPGRSDRTPADSLVTRLAGVLPRDIVVHVAREVSGDFDARFGALWRRYRYRISDGPAVHDPLRRDVLRLRRHLDVEAMAEASRGLLGEHDFLSYCRPRDRATTIRTLRELSWERPEPGRADAGLVVGTVVADAFCHHMVRSLVGVLIGVGEGRHGVDRPMEVLDARTRVAATHDTVGAAPICPPQGLTLEHVAYPPDEELAARAALARARRG